MAAQLASRLRSTATSATRSATAPWLLAILAVHAAIRTYAFAVSPTVTYPDTLVYMGTAALPFTNAEWWRGPRPPVAPFAYWLVGDTASAIVVLQLVLAIVAWSILAVVVASLVRIRWLQPAAAALVLAFSLTPEIAEWDRIVLSESITLSLLALLVAALLAYVQRPGRLVLAATLVVAALWVFARDADAYGLLLAAPVFVVGAIAEARHRRLHAIAAAGCLVIFAASFASANAGLRWEFSFYNVLGTRLLRDPVAVRTLAGHGMPVSQPLLAMAGKNAASDNHAFLNDPHLASLRTWVRAEGQRAYLTFLVEHPRASILTPGSQLLDLLSQNVAVKSYAPRAASPLGATADWLFPGQGMPGALLAAATGFAAATALTAGWRRTWLVPIALIATAAPLAILVYLADAGEIGRHELVPAVQARLGLWLLLLFAIDVIAVWRRNQPPA